VPSAVALMNYISSGLLWRIFCQTGIFRGVFSPYIIYITGRVSAAVMAGDIIFFASLVQWEITLGPPYSDFSRGLFYTVLCIILQKEEQSCNGLSGGGGHYIFLGAE
jgi:hypothetical protein